MPRLFRPRTMVPSAVVAAAIIAAAGCRPQDSGISASLVLPRCAGVIAQPKSTSHTNSEAAPHEYVACCHRGTRHPGSGVPQSAARHKHRHGADGNWHAFLHHFGARRQLRAVHLRWDHQLQRLQHVRLEQLLGRSLMQANRHRRRSGQLVGQRQ